MIEAAEIIFYALAVAVSFAIVGLGIPLTIKGVLYILRKKE